MLATINLKVRVPAYLAVATERGARRRECMTISQWARCCMLERCRAAGLIEPDDIGPEQPGDAA